MAKYPLNWSLETLGPVPTKAELTPVLDALKQNLKQVLERLQSAPELSVKTVATWEELLDQFIDVASELHHLDALVSCYCAGDAENQEYRYFEGEVVNLSAHVQSASMLLELMMKSLDEQTLEAIYETSEKLASLKLYFADLKRRSDLRLSADMEQLAIDLSVDSQLAFGRIYDRISGELKIKVQTPDGLVSKSPGQIELEDPSRRTRKALFNATDRAWFSIAAPCAEALNHLSGTRLTRYRHAGLQDHLDAPLVINRMKRETLATMWEAIGTIKAELASYLSEKAELLGVEKLHWYDLTAPIPLAHSSGSPKYTYQYACDEIIKSFHGFSSDLGDFAEMALTKGWVEAEPRGGKRQGGFCTDLSRSKQSRIFMTYNDNWDAISTLAHELGHAYHSWVLRESPFVMKQYPMSLAETASTFAEAVLGQTGLKASTSVSDRLLRLGQLCDDSSAFLMNIHARFLFEDRFHQQRRSGELSIDQFSQLMHEAQLEGYAGGLCEEGTAKSFWISKLHFYIGNYPFYNFPYTVGYMLSQGIYKLGVDQPEGFSDRYRDFLMATGANTVEDSVQQSFGYDLTQPDFWMLCLDTVRERLKLFTESKLAYQSWLKQMP